MLFSATIPPEVHKIASLVLLPSHKHISALSETDTAMHEPVVQRLLVVPPAELFPVLARLLAQRMAEDASTKVMVFASTAWALWHRWCAEFLVLDTSEY
jgi:ATP-dependent RNA helicase MSS116